MLEFVELLLNSCDNIISQLILLKKFKHHKEVRKYMKALEKENISPYERYCINKFFYGLDVKYEEIPDFYYPTLSAYGNEFIEGLIGDIPNLKDQVLKLKEYKDNAKVNDYVDEKFPYFFETNPYAKNIILTYYYDVPNLDITPTAKSLHITLGSIYFKKLIQKQEKREKKLIRKNSRRLKVGDRIILEDGPFKGMEGVVLEKGSEFIKLEMKLFGDKTPCDMDYLTKFKKVGKKKC